MDSTEHTGYRDAPIPISTSQVHVQFDLPNPSNIVDDKLAPYVFHAAYETIPHEITVAPWLYYNRLPPAHMKRGRECKFPHEL
jgi:hypothetical protein